ncbi:MAG: tRNA epoxyqueuosine(34) reductase QueG [Anaerolineae bacterium]
MNLTEQVCNRARDLGFDLVGVAPARSTARLSVSTEPSDRASGRGLDEVSPNSPYLDAYRAWLAHSYHGEMGYLARPDRVERREDPAKILPEVRSIVCAGLNYYPGPLPADLRSDPSRGLISNYAWGLDYHDLMLGRLEELAAFITTAAGRDVASRAYVDTGPVLERAYAAEAGLGFIGKNTCLIHPQMGSWLFLGEVLLDVALEPTPEKIRLGCGTCRRCLDACPTRALVAPYVLDARRCISYLTIELKGPIPRELRPLMGNWVYGCDVCQAACPWQRFAKPTKEPSFQAEGPDRAAPVLLDLMEISEDTFRQRYEGTVIFRIGRDRLLRNAAVALGNWGDERAVPALARALTDAEPLVREHAAWALGRVGGQVARKTLEEASQGETDTYVRQEIQMALLP